MKAVNKRVYMELLFLFISNIIISLLVVTFSKLVLNLATMVILVIIIALALAACSTWLINYSKYSSAKDFPTLTDIYKKIPVENRTSCNAVSEKLMLDDIMNYYTTLQNGNLLRQYALIKARLGTLQSQINPHFLYNTLESIRGFCIIRKQREIANLIESLSILFRHSLQSIDQLVTLKEELDNVMHYLSIQQFRFPGKFVYIENIEDRENLMNCKLPNMTVQPIIENAIFHGLEQKLEDGRIDLRAYLTDKRLIIRVSDNGVGISDSKSAHINELLQTNSVFSDYDPDKTPNKHDHGIGMANINTRIKLQFGNEYGIAISSTRNVGTQVEITLPIIQ